MSDNLQKKFYDQSSLTLEKDSLFIVVVRDTILAIVDSYRQNYLRARRQSSNVVNRIPSEVIQYNTVIAELKREALQNQAKEEKMMIKKISRGYCRFTS